MSERHSPFMYKQLIKSYLGDEKLFDETPMRGRKAAFPDPREKRRAFEAMTLPHIDSLYGVALRLTRDRHDAENLVQDVFLRAFRFFDRYTMGTNCRAWLFRILYNTFINEYHRRVRASVTIDSDLVHLRRDEESLKSGPRSETEEAALARFVDREVIDALAKIPVDFKLPILLADVELMGYDEISRTLDIPVGTVKSRIFRGRRLLRELLRDYGRENGYIR